MFKTFGTQGKDYDDFRNAIAQKESTNNYSLNEETGYWGRYQLDYGTLNDIGWMNKDKKGNPYWTDKAKAHGVTSLATFLSNHAAQDTAFDLVFKRYWEQLVTKGATAYIGQKYMGVTVTTSGLLAAAHLVGAGGITMGLQNGVEKYDYYGTSASSYMKDYGGYKIPWATY
jgi:hypothetical protein